MNRKAGSSRSAQERRVALAVTTAAAAIALGACAGQDAGEANGTARASTPSISDCLVNRNLRNYTLLDDRNLVIYGIGGQPYHVVLATPALDLSGEIGVGLLDRDGNGQICPYGGDAIIVEDPVPERIPLASVEQIDDERVEQLRIQFGVIDAPEGEFSVTPVD